MCPASKGRGRGGRPDTWERSVREAQQEVGADTKPAWHWRQEPEPEWKYEPGSHCARAEAQQRARRMSTTRCGIVAVFVCVVKENSRPAHNDNVRSQSRSPPVGVAGSAAGSAPGVLVLASVAGGTSAGGCSFFTSGSGLGLLTMGLHERSSEPLWSRMAVAVMAMAWCLGRARCAARPLSRKASCSAM